MLGMLLVCLLVLINKNYVIIIMYRTKNITQMRSVHRWVLIYCFGSFSCSLTCVSHFAAHSDTFLCKICCKHSWIFRNEKFSDSQHFYAYLFALLKCNESPKQQQHGVCCCLSLLTHHLFAPIASFSSLVFFRHHHHTLSCESKNLLIFYRRLFH